MGRLEPIGGTYVLICELGQETGISVGRAGRIDFAGGYYAYVGSALNGLEARVNRHLSTLKKKHWHIDYLLDYARARSVVFTASPNRAECLIASKIAGGSAGIAGFGSSDCRCQSHLFYCATVESLETMVTAAFEKVFGRLPSCLSVTGTPRSIPPDPGVFSASYALPLPDSPGA